MTSKIEEGNLRAAIRLLSSNEAIAQYDIDSAERLRSKHTSAPSEAQALPHPDDFEPLLVTVDAVYDAIRSFPAGSSGGSDGFCPQHLVDLVCCKLVAPDLLNAITTLSTFFCAANAPLVQPILFGGEQKQIRPIAIGYFWRRLAAKCANKHAINRLQDYFSPLQLGVGVPGGCEAAFHSVRRFLDGMPIDWGLVKIDFCNAFNSISAKVMLEAVGLHLPKLYRFCHMSYVMHSSLLFGEFLISSEVGVQQGDPLGPFCFVWSYSQ